MINLLPIIINRLKIMIKVGKEFKDLINNNLITDSVMQMKEVINKINIIEEMKIETIPSAQGRVEAKEWKHLSNHIHFNEMGTGNPTFPNRSRKAKATTLNKHREVGAVSRNTLSARELAEERDLIKSL